MSSFETSESWIAAKQWLDLLDRWTDIRQTKVLDEANLILGSSPQEWFSKGVQALNACIQPETARPFFYALHKHNFDINKVHYQLMAQDMAWQPHAHSLECITGAAIWQKSIGTLAFNINWAMAELDPTVRNPILLEFLRGTGRYDKERMAWHKTLCIHNAWALDTTFTWALDYPMPQQLHWAFKLQHCPSEVAMTKIVDFCIHRQGKNKSQWEQLDRLRPDLALYVQNYLLIHQELTGFAPSSELGAALSNSWRYPNAPLTPLPSGFENSV